MAIRVTVRADSIHPEPVPLERGEKVYWWNESGKTIVLSLPKIFVEKDDPPPIPDQTRCNDFEVKKKAKPGRSDYEISTDGMAVPRNGTIDVR